MIHHTDDPICPMCEEKLAESHPDLINWFHWVKTNHPEVHIAWSFRDQVSQDSDYAAGRSKLQWPLSKHNNMLFGKPYSKALDVFQDKDGQAIFDGDFYRVLNDETQASGFKIRWGGSFQSFPDLDHFELIDFEDANA